MGLFGCITQCFKGCLHPVTTWFGDFFNLTDDDLEAPLLNPESFTNSNISQGSNLQSLIGTLFTTASFSEAAPLNSDNPQTYGTFERRYTNPLTWFGNLFNVTADSQLANPEAAPEAPPPNRVTVVETTGSTTVETTTWYRRHWLDFWGNPFFAPADELEVAPLTSENLQAHDTPARGYNPLTWFRNLFRTTTNLENSQTRGTYAPSTHAPSTRSDDSSSSHVTILVEPLPPNMVPPAPGMMPLPPPLLLTKRVTAFLRANLSDLLRAAVLTTPAGNLLVHASNLPASILRRQCAVAASLWSMHSPPPSGGATHNGAEGSSSGSSPAPSGSTTTVPSPAVTVQLDSGAVFVIRQLQCGMLFICMGGEEGAATSSAAGGSTSAAASAATSDNAGEDLGPGSGSSSATAPGTGNMGGTSPLASPSEVDSVHSSGTAGAATTASQGTAGTSAAGGLSPASVLALRRQVEELARWLDARLGSLYVPEIGIGAGMGVRA
ncbi:hypothetical protein B0T16DRAFT_448618 [Cercophora newfieldiana]|uniref:Uncharacterized protein n=1 Tax=Cercophora newfieldiana TaxID=92897 RepID=A0AA39XVK4_9PEZI|nr:hypothetical protein B0T16DRAFT_448618 [Cercophora newfieldiana]